MSRQQRPASVSDLTNELQMLMQSNEISLSFSRCLCTMVNMTKQIRLILFPHGPFQNLAQSTVESLSADISSALEHFKGQVGAETERLHRAVAQLPSLPPASCGSSKASADYDCVASIKHWIYMLQPFPGVRATEELIITRLAEFYDHCVLQPLFHYQGREPGNELWLAVKPCLMRIWTRFAELRTAFGDLNVVILQLHGCARTGLQALRDVSIDVKILYYQFALCMRRVDARYGIAEDGYTMNDNGNTEDNGIIRVRSNTADSVNSEESATTEDNLPRSAERPRRWGYTASLTEVIEEMAEPEM